MTIAACYVSPEGVVLGADSTTTFAQGGANHYYNQAQKLFELGEGGSLGAVTWGLGGLGAISYRKLFAIFSDDLKTRPAGSFDELGQRWADHFWAHYEVSDVFVELVRLSHLAPHNSAVPPAATMRTAEEDELYAILHSAAGVGFCFGGWLSPDRTPAAFSAWFHPLVGKPSPVALHSGFNFWGAPNMIQRLIFGYDDHLKAGILKSGHWTGTEADLDQLLQSQGLAHPPSVPMRDAIDFVHTGILSTIKALKFSNFSQICGGPIEIAVITADRPFRWVQHKPWDSAITNGAA